MLLNKNLEQLSVSGSSDNCLLITLPNCFIVRVSKKEDKQQFDDFVLENSGDFNGIF